MHFVLVNDRRPRGLFACACCRNQLEFGYLREISSHQVYCSYECFELRRTGEEGDRAGFDFWSIAMPG
jgi:hypothetical protein